MWIFSFYRLYLSVAAGIGAAYLFLPVWWFGIICTVLIRAAIAGGEHIAALYAVNRLFTKHSYTFRQELGPYGIRMVNRAEKDTRLRKSLAEVFVASEKKLRKALEQLELMDTLYKAGMQPDADTWQLHDLKLKYARFRLEQIDKGK